MKKCLMVLTILGFIGCTKPNTQPTSCEKAKDIYAKAEVVMTIANTGYASATALVETVCGLQAKVTVRDVETTKSLSDACSKAQGALLIARQVLNGAQAALVAAKVGLDAACGRDY